MNSDLRRASNRLLLELKLGILQFPCRSYCLQGLVIAFIRSDRFAMLYVDDVPGVRMMPNFVFNHDGY